jgi:hypothetical protein
MESSKIPLIMYLKKKHLPSGRKEKNASNRRPVGLRPAGRFLSIFADCTGRCKIGHHFPKFSKLF